MTTVYSWRWLLAHYLAKESVASITAFPFKKTAIILPKPSNRVCYGGLWQELIDPE
jgi:hypothetical protein